MSEGLTQTRCCVVGGGPAGMVLGLLLARAGVAVTVLEKHGDFLRDFRGDTVHPSTLEIIDQLGLRAEFDALPQHRVDHLEGIVGGRRQPLVDFRGLHPYGYLALVPQWDFLDLLAREGRRHPSFDLRMRHGATDLLREQGQVVGVQVQGPDGAYDLRADLVVACDGRHSTLRGAAGLEARDYGAPMDVLWFRLPRKDDDPQDTFGIVDRGHMMVLLNRDDYWQVAYLVPKGGDTALRAQPLQVLRDGVAELAPFLADRKDAIAGWDEVSTLTVKIDRLPRWHQPGLLLIGDAAHAMSPIGGVGINLAIQDAVAAANRLAGPLRGGGPIDESVLAQVQQRREFPVRVVQRVQMLMQRKLISRVLEQRGEPPRVPGPLRWLLGFRAVRHVPARLFGYGLRRERVECGPARDA
ncbi:FAD-dependent oxidoreductase [Fulvimonas sp. R45]|uniref:FAD-dependent oxidoreductase n=1 Tax=Fulvimonas sp. R45 TaxID=3045937 RepID=UPI00265F719B|nr:FAD-dependent oxidoreductase [Fulvimonas sp. R45]MDO1527844.1 FAD-dependent oxidoreductase [Fulvimonas sp. R45]